MSYKVPGRCLMLVGFFILQGCGGDATLPDTQRRAAGSSVQDRGFGLGSGGFTSSSPEEAATAGEGAVVQEAGGHTFGGGK